jgi:hypothetical protein
VQINRPDIVSEVRAAFERYEAALIANEVSVLNDFFWSSEHAVRYGIAEESYGIEAIRRYRTAALPVHPGRTLGNTVITTFGDSFASVCTEFEEPERAQLGRQTQTWVRFADGWKIVMAQVSARKREERGYRKPE